MLPKPFLDSLEGLPGFEKNAFEQVHAQGEQITSVRLNKYKQFDLYTHSFLNHTTPVSWCAQGVYLNERPLFVLDPATAQLLLPLPLSGFNVGVFSTISFLPKYKLSIF